jgi:hypothetical protein
VLHRKRADRSEAPHVPACISSPVRLGAIFDQRYRSRMSYGEQSVEISDGRAQMHNCHFAVVATDDPTRANVYPRIELFPDEITARADREHLDVGDDVDMRHLHGKDQRHAMRRSLV